MKIGIITLHRVINYGSALQAYALQQYINKEGLGEAELIDYVFPNKFHKKKLSFKKWLRRLYCVQIRDMYFRGRRFKIKRMKDFCHDYFRLSPKLYNSVEEIMANPPEYDLYMTGSDQLWNVRTLRNDPVPYCEFAPANKRRVAYAASFTNQSLPKEYWDSVRNRLNKYSHIGVRESSSLQIVKDLQIRQDIVVRNNCDPTLLLDANDYDSLAVKPNYDIDGDFVLVYALQYAYKPEQAINSIVWKLREQTGLKFVFLDYYKASVQKGDVMVEGIGPCEFCWLFSHAKFVIASSFHGTVFSIINRKPFYVVAPPKNDSDHRINDFLECLGLEKRYIPADEEIGNVSLMSPYTEEFEKKLKAFTDDSKKYLLNAINNIQ